MIRDRDDYDELTPHTLLGKLQQHEMADQAVIKAVERVPNAVMPNIVGASKGVAIKAKHEDEHNNQVKSRSNNASKSKEVVESSTSEDDSSNDEDQDVAMFIRSFKRIIKGGNNYKKSFGDKYKKRNKKRQCYECGEVGHYIADCPKKKNDGKKEWRKDKYKKDDKNKEYKKKRYQCHAHVGEEWDSEDESSSSDDEGVASIAIQRASPGSCLFTNLTDDESNPIPTCLMAKGKKVPIETPPPSDDDKENMMKEFGEKGYKLIKRLMEKLEKREMSLEMQEDLLVLEKEINLVLENSLAKANEKVEKLALELTIANDSIEEKNIDIAKANSSIDSLKEANVTLQENLSCLSGKNKDLEVQLASLRKSNFSSTKVILDSNVSTSKGYKRCYNHDTDICAANLDKLGKLEKEVKLLKTLVKDEMLTKDDGSKKDVTKFKPLWNNPGHNPNKENPRKIINDKSCL